MNDPRTPPALSNATPRPSDESRKDAIVRSLLRSTLLYLTASYENGQSFPETPDNLIESIRTFLSGTAAAPPVAEGPATTPEPIEDAKLRLDRIRETLGYHEMAGNLAKPNWGWFYRQALSEIRDSLSMPVADIKREIEAMQKYPIAAAEPFTPNAVEARAAAWMWSAAEELDDEGHLAHNSLDQIVAIVGKHAADLQRQLDEARRELADSREWHKQACEDREEVDRMYAEAKARIEGLTGQLEGLAINRDETLKKLKRAESAEAANQELRSELACQWEANHAEHCGIWPHPDKDVCHWPKPAALLGPQHGDTK